MKHCFISSLFILLTALLHQVHSHETFVVQILKFNRSEPDWTQWPVTHQFLASHADFGPHLGHEYSILGFPVKVDPVDGCGLNVTAVVGENFVPQPVKKHNYFIGFIPMVKRGNCSFAEKTFRSQTLFAEYEFGANVVDAVIVYDNGPDRVPIPMAADDQFAASVTVSAFMISLNAANKILQNNNISDENYVIEIKAGQLDNNINAKKRIAWYWLTVLVVITICVFSCISLCFSRQLQDNN